MKIQTVKLGSLWVRVRAAIYQTARPHICLCPHGELKIRPGFLGVKESKIVIPQDAFANATLGVTGQCEFPELSREMRFPWKREGDKAPASFKNAFSWEVACREKKKPPISPPDSWKMSRMSQHSGVWVGSCVCLHSSISGVFSEFPAGRTLCPWGAENIPWGPSTAALLDLLCSQCMSVCRAGGQKWPEYPWDNGNESSGRS